jgi:DNA topoisomerase I
MPRILPEESAGMAGLKYVTDKNLCYRRVRGGKSFFYLDEEGKRITDKKAKERFLKLVIPPAWEDVFICKSPNGHIQATGRDQKGRKQYIYHEKWDVIRNESKFHRLLEFAEKLPVIRKQVEEDLRKKSLVKEKVLAIIITLLEETLIRVGNEEYAKKNKSYGLTTLQDKHLEVEGNKLFFEFTGKSGKETVIAMNDKRLARLVKQCQDIPGQQLFQYFDEDGKRQPVDSNDVNEYLKGITEEDFTAKDFRTWGGTVKAVEVLYTLGEFQNEREKKRKITASIKHVAKVLNNTVSICRKYYVHPDVIEAYESGELAKEMEKWEKKYNSDTYKESMLNLEEFVTLSLLKRGASEKKKILKAS